MRRGAVPPPTVLRVFPLSARPSDGRFRSCGDAREEGVRPPSSLQPLVARRVTRDEADVVAQVGVPARTGFGARVAGGVPANAGDHGVGVAGVGVDGDPATEAGFAPLGHWAGGKRAFDEFTAVEGEADRAGAVV